MHFSTSIFLLFFTPLLGIALMFTSAYSWYNISHLYLPLSKVPAFLGTFIPILSLTSLQYLRGAHRQPTKTRPRKASAPPPITDKIFFGIFGLLLLDTALITLSSTSLPSKPHLCPLNERWTHLWLSPSEQKSPHPALRTIQDSLNCCGLHSSRDKFYPFPKEKNVSHSCTETYPNREGRACYTPWLQQTQLSASLLLAVAAGSMVMKIVGLILIRYHSHPWVQGFLYNPWFSKQSRISEEEVATGQSRIRNVDVDIDEDDETFVYDRDATVRRAGHESGNARERYLDAPAGENDRLLGHGDEVNGNSGETRRPDLYHNEGGFGALQPSLLR